MARQKSKFRPGARRSGNFAPLPLPGRATLPRKICPVCDRPFTWRKKWADCWEEVKYCSQRCRQRRHLATEKSEGEN